jgi:hypothetical protein
MTQKHNLILPFILFLSVCLILVAFPISVQADSGPKPSLTIKVKHPPKELYYLDLLVNYDGKYDNLSNMEENLDEQKLNLLKNYDLDGWYPALVNGTDIPLHGSLIGSQQENVTTHRFSYFGVPDVYRIIIITPDNQIHVSEIMEKKTYQETVSLDYQSLDLTYESEELPKEYESMSLQRVNRWLDLLLQFCSTFLPTLIIEGILLIAFGFSIRKNWKLFLFTNLVTQLGMTMFLTYLLPHYGVFWSSFFFLPWIEVIILVLETILYRIYLTGQSKRRATLYGISANIASYIGSVAVLNFYSPWLT